MAEQKKKKKRPPPTPSFICEFGLVVTPEDAAQLERRFEAARQYKNALIGEARHRLRLMQDSRHYTLAVKLRGQYHAIEQRIEALGKKSRTNAAQLAVLEKESARLKGLANDAYSAAREATKFSEYALHSFETRLGKGHWNGQPFSSYLDSNTRQKLATGAFRACNTVLTLHRGMPRFKGKHQALGSLEGKSNTFGIRFRVDSEETEIGMVFKPETCTVLWSGLTLKVRVDEHDAYHRHALEAKTKYVRVIRRMVKGTLRWYVQLVCEGQPIPKRPSLLAYGHVVGLDLGPSTLAAVSDDHAQLSVFCQELNPKTGLIRRLQRQLERSRRQSHPDNYDAPKLSRRRSKSGRLKAPRMTKGSIKQGVKLLWKNSKTYVRTRVHLADLQRQEAAHRKSLHGRLTNDLLEQGTVFRTEKLSMKAWQKIFGRSVARNAPGMFMTLLTRKAESAGGTVQSLNTWSLKLSQTCVCGAVKKKALSERLHTCPCGAVVQRDLLSAYLARHVDPDTQTLCAEAALSGFPGADSLLQTAHQEALRTTAIHGPRVTSVGSLPRRSGSSGNGSQPLNEVLDAVPGHRESQKEFGESL